MEASKILQADFLDLLFDKRNKQYGAYSLRRLHNRRLWLAVAITLLVSFSLFWLLKPSFSNQAVTVLEQKEIVLTPLEELKTTIPPPPPPLKEEIKNVQPVKGNNKSETPKLVNSKLKRTQFTTPVATDKAITNPMPPMDKIGVVDNVTIDGIMGNEILAPAAPFGEDLETGGGNMAVVEPVIAKKEDENKIFEKVEIAASVNEARWRLHLEKNLVQYIEEAAYAGIAPGMYTVRVRFIVERDGSIADVKALNDPGFGLAQGATKVVKSGPKWTPGEQNGRKVRSYHTQPITFMVVEQ